VRGLNTKLIDLYTKSVGLDYDVILFTETWLKPETLNLEILASEYTIYRKDRNLTVTNLSKGGGVLIAVKSLYNSREVILSSNEEIDFCCIYVKFECLAMYITCSYIPPNSNASIYANHLGCINKAYEKLCDTDRLIVFGDFNLPKVNWIINTDMQNVLLPFAEVDFDASFVNDISSLGLHQINRIHNSYNRFLDLIFVDDPDSFDLYRSSPFVTPEDNHHPTLLVKIAVPNDNMHKFKTETCIKNYCFSKTNYSTLKNYLRGLDWRNIFHLTDDYSNLRLPIALDSFNNILLESFKHSVPQCHLLDVPCPTWFTKKLRNLRNLKTKYYKLYCRIDSATNYINYTSTKYLYHRLCKEAYDKYLNKLKSSWSRYPKSFWSFVNIKRKCNMYPAFLKLKSIESNNIPTICNMFGEFFMSTYSKSTYCSSNYPYSISTGSTPYPIINEIIVLEALKGVKCNFKPGPDNIPACILKFCAEELASPITLLFDYSLRSGCFPAIWKSSYIIPLHKSGNKSNITNYRGIAKLSALPKLFEKIITDQISRCVSSFTSPSQHGFCSGKSTTTNLLEFVSRTIRNFSLGLQTDVIYTDFSKAFDVVNHDLLILKLNIFGFPPYLLKWITSYLDHRTQRVLYRNHLSNEFTVTSGVPQGSHLGPLMFLIFINDLPTVISDSNILMFADDVKLFLSYKSQSDALLLQNDLNRLVEWCKINCIMLNLNKCKQISFSRSRFHVFNYAINSYNLDIVESIVDLGILLDRKLRFNLHINQICSKANTALGFIKRWAKEFNDPYLTKMLYTSLVRPILEYASPVWSPHTACNIDAIESVQKQFLLFSLRDLHWDPNLRLPSYKSRLKLINLPSLNNRRIMLNSIFILKLLYGSTVSAPLLSNIYLNVPRCVARRHNFLHLSFCRSSYAQQEPLRSACSDFNLISPSVNLMDSIYVSKQNILNFLSE
jgi:hypothetical protein